MPLYEYECLKCGYREEHWREIDRRDTPIHCVCLGPPMKRLPGGHKMLHFEEGRGRTHISLSDKPITSYAEQKRLMRVNGVVESGDTVPPSVAKNPRSIGMQRFMERGKKGRWV